MLLRAGMSVKQALVYNILSSVLCIFGMVIGVILGNFSSANQWIFAMTAGIFIYISLVDMVCSHILLQLFCVNHTTSFVNHYTRSELEHFQF